MKSSSIRLFFVLTFKWLCLKYQNEVAFNKAVFLFCFDVYMAVFEISKSSRLQCIYICIYIYVCIYITHYISISRKNKRMRVECSPEVGVARVYIYIYIVYIHVYIHIYVCTYSARIILARCSFFLSSSSAPSLFSSF